MLQIKISEKLNEKIKCVCGNLSSNYSKLSKQQKIKICEIISEISKESVIIIDEYLLSKIYICYENVDDIRYFNEDNFNEFIESINNYHRNTINNYQKNAINNYYEKTIHNFSLCLKNEVENIYIFKVNDVHTFMMNENTTCYEFKKLLDSKYGTGSVYYYENDVLLWNKDLIKNAFKHDKINKIKYKNYSIYYVPQSVISS